MRPSCCCSVALAACSSSDEVKSITATDDRGVSNQPFPNNYRAEILAFMKTYLNNPEKVRDAGMAEPVQRTVGGRLRYVSCLRFSVRESDGTYREPRERAVLFVDRRLDRVIENAGELCAGATYAPFPSWKRSPVRGRSRQTRRLPGGAFEITRRKPPATSRSRFSER